MSAPFTALSYTGQNLRDALVAASHTKSETLRSKTHAEYLDAYLAAIGVKTMVIEHEYVDRDFLEDFAAYHVRCFTGYSRNCSRLHFFGRDFDADHLESILVGSAAPEQLQECYLGFIVVKPLPNTIIGRTCLATYPARTPGRERHFPTLREEHSNLFGIDLSIKSLPFQEQDQDVAACASSALWSVLNGTSRIFQHATLSPVEITKAAGLHIRLENRHFPAGGGLTSNQIADAIRNVGLEPHAISARENTVLQIAIFAYLRAGIPCMLLGHLHQVMQDGPTQLLGGHAIAVAGFGKAVNNTGGALASGCRLKGLSLDRLYCHDDQVGPFARFTIEPDGLRNDSLSPHAKFCFEPTVLLTPLYHKIRIPVSDILEIILEMDLLIETVRSADLLPFPERATWDIRLGTVNSLKSQLRSSSVSAANKRRLLTRTYPRFLWHLEVSIEGKDVFEMLMDATDLLQGDHLIDVIPYDNEACLAIAAVISQIRSALSHRPRIDRILGWFSDNEQLFLET